MSPPGGADPWPQVVRRLDGLRLLVRDEKEPRLAKMHRAVADVVIKRMGADAAAARWQAVLDEAMTLATQLFNSWRDQSGEQHPNIQHAVCWLAENDPDYPAADPASS